MNEHEKIIPLKLTAQPWTEESMVYVEVEQRHANGKYPYDETLRIYIPVSRVKEVIQALDRARKRLERGAGDDVYFWADLTK